MSENIDSLLPIIRSQISKLRICSAQEKVFKDECVYSFDTPFLKDGLYVNLVSLQGFGADFVNHDISRGGILYLLEKWTKVDKPEESISSEHPTPKLIIKDDVKYDIIKIHSLAVATDQGLEVVTIPNNQIPEFVSNVIQSVIDHDGMRSKMQSGTWDASEPPPAESRYASTLTQLNNGIKISQDPSMWKCQESGDTQNLWLNLSTGYIGGGRKNWDGTGGSGAALKHYEDTGRQYPLCVKLGTITANGADVWSYSPEEDCPVTDPLLAEHLSHWGIDIMKLEKTDKSLQEMEEDLNYSYDWSKLMEGGEGLELLRGPGLIGLQNIGSSCYLASVLQSLLNVPEIHERYLSSRAYVLQSAPPLPAEDFSCQMSKLAEGLLTNRYCPQSLCLDGSVKEPPDVPEEFRIAPRMFKQCVAKGHGEFSSGRQQDASEYLMYLLEVMERSERISMTRLHPDSDPVSICKRSLPSSKLFEFQVETRYACTVTQQVRYVAGGRQAVNSVLEFRIPQDAAVNKLEVEQYQERKKQRLESPSSDEQSNTHTSLQLQEEPRLLVPFKACLDTFFGEETIEGYRNPSLGGLSAPALKRQRMQTFPRYLIVKLGRYYVGSNWVQVKVDARVPVPEKLDLNSYRATSLQPGEYPMPEDSNVTLSPGDISARAAVVPDETLVSQLMDMGFSANGSRRAAVATNNSDVEVAMTWVLEHMDDANFNDPVETEVAATVGGSLGAPAEEAVSVDGVDTLCAMGYTSSQAMAALRATSNNLDRAIDWIFSHADDLDAAVAAQSASSNTNDCETNDATPSSPTAVEDGDGKYTLIAMITHIGKNTDHGHFVCHLRGRDPEQPQQWALFNDENVARSKNPPFDQGFMYFYRRDDGPGQL